MAALQETILVVDDDPYIQEALADRLESLGYRVLAASDGNQALAVIEKSDPHLVFLDIEIPGIKGLDVLREVHRKNLNLPVVMITAYGSIDVAVESMKEGAYDFITKPFKPDLIAPIVHKALDRQRLNHRVEYLSQEIDRRYHLVAGTSAGMAQAIDTAKKSAGSKSTILLLGESGTGKELFARAIHNWSERKASPFVAINCVGLSRELLESELFGHERGAFTGAHQLKRGKIELADGGTVFLDEIGDISPEIQTKLLRFLQEREFERVGGTDPIRVDVRIIAATNQPLEQSVKEGRFRNDLYFRLNVVPIYLPPLRERKEDLAELTDYLLHRSATEAKKHFTGIAPEAMEKLMAYDWPGNIRELANTIERAVVLGYEPIIQSRFITLTPIAEPSNDDAEPMTYHDAVNFHRREILRRALVTARGNRAAAAKLLGLERTYLVRLMKSFNIE